MNKNKKIWIGGISLLLALLLFAVLLIIQQSMKEEPQSDWVICAKTDIPQNVVFTEENISSYVEKKYIPVMWLPKEYISSEDSLVGMIVKSDMAQGNMFSNMDVEQYDTYYAAYEQLNWISVPINELYEGVAGSLRGGDYIDIYLLTKQEEEYQCELLQERVPIAYAYTSQGSGIETESEDGLCQLIVIPIEKNATADFYQKLAQGNIRIAKYEAG